MLVFPTRTRRSALVALLSLLAFVVLPGVATAKVLTKPTWLPKVVVTEYYPAPEWWFVGAQVKTPGLSRKSRIDWLYSARGVSMEGEGIGLDGRKYHIDSIGSSGWITERGRRAQFGRGGIFAPFWRAAGYWRNGSGGVTFPLDAGGWYDGEGKKYVAPANITFAPGQSKPVRYYRSVAVDPTLIPLGSLVYVPAYKPLNKDGWFRADDVGGAIKGRHIDVYRRPPDSPSDTGRYLKDRRIFIVPKDDVATYVRKAHMSAGALPAIPRRLLRAPAR
jgi:3D (Asp-Asp-Asp) domain-containing protein